MQSWRCACQLRVEGAVEGATRRPCLPETHSRRKDSAIALARLPHHLDRIEEEQSPTAPAVQELQYLWKLVNSRGHQGEKVPLIRLGGTCLDRIRDSRKLPSCGRSCLVKYAEKYGRSYPSVVPADCEAMTVREGPTGRACIAPSVSHLLGDQEGVGGKGRCDAVSSCSFLVYIVAVWAESTNIAVLPQKMYADLKGARASSGTEISPLPT